MNSSAEKKPITTTEICSTHFNVGDKFLINEMGWVVTHIREDIDVVRLREVNGTRKFETTIAGFKQRIRRGSARLQRGTSKLTLSSLALATLTEAERRQYEFRKVYTILMLDLPERISKALRLEAIQKLHSERAAEQKANGEEPEDIPKLSTLFAWKKQVENANGLFIVLAFANHRKAKRTNRLSDDVLEILTDAYKEIFTSELRFTVSDIMSVVTARIKLANENRDPLLPQLKVPCRNTLSDYLLRFDPLGTYEGRFGKHRTRHTYNYGGRLKAPDYVCGLVYADCHLLDLLVRDDLLDITYRPWLCVLLCAKTRCVIGWEISSLPPSAEKLARALKMAVSESGGSEFRGTPVVLLVDNGPEFRNGTHREIANILNIQITFPPPKTPNAKAPVERFFRTINFLIHRLPGTTASNPFAKGDYDSEGNAIFSLSGVRETFTDILNIYHHRSLSNLGQAPKTLWQTCVAKHPPRVFEKEFVETLGAQVVKRSIKKGRVEVKGISWNSSALPETKARLAPGGIVHVHYDPNDLTYAWVRNPQEPESVIRCEPCDPAYQTGLTMRVHQEIMRETGAHEASTGNEIKMHFLKARFILRALEAAKNAKKVRSRTNRAKAEWHEQLIRSAEAMNDVVLTSGSSPISSKDAEGKHGGATELTGSGWGDIPTTFIATTEAPSLPPKSTDWDDVPTNF